MKIFRFFFSVSLLLVGWDGIDEPFSRNSQRVPVNPDAHSQTKNTICLKKVMSLMKRESKIGFFVSFFFPNWRGGFDPSVGGVSGNGAQLPPFKQSPSWHLHDTMSARSTQNKRNKHEWILSQRNCSCHTHLFTSHNFPVQSVVQIQSKHHNTNSCDIEKIQFQIEKTFFGWQQEKKCRKTNLTKDQIDFNFIISYILVLFQVQVVLLVSDHKFLHFGIHLPYTLILVEKTWSINFF